MVVSFVRVVALTSALFVSASAQAQSGNLIDQFYGGYMPPGARLEA
ncbi:MAG: hypothetical protein ACJAXK_002204 [Yoonia sp.]|jgi:hypothetical protein